MRPGPHEDLLAQGSVIGARISVMRGSQVLATDVPVKDVQLDVTADRVVPEKLTYTAPRDWIPAHPLSPLNSFGQRSHLTITQEIGGQPYETHIGWFTHGSADTEGWAETDDGVEVTAFGLLQIVEDNPAAWPSSPPPGATIRTELQRLAGMPVIVEGTDLPIPRTLQWGVSRTEAIQDLCESFGLESSVNPDGYLHVWPRRDIYHDAPAARYTGALIVDTPRLGVPRRASRIVGVGSGENDRRYTTVVNASEPPYDLAGYGEVTERIELSGTVDEKAVAAAANARLRMLTISKRIRSLETILDPRVETGDIITAVTKSDEHITGRVVAYSLNPQAGESMRIDIEEML